MQLVQKFELKLSTSLIDEIMNAFKGPHHTVDQKQLKSFYLEEYPEYQKYDIIRRKRNKTIQKKKSKKRSKKNEKIQTKINVENNKK